MATGPWKGDHRLSTTWRYSSGSAHYSWDVACPRGTELYAIGNGTIVDCADGQPDPAPRRYSGVPSNWIILRFTFPSGPYAGKTGYAYYQHLTKGGVLVRRGQSVRKGQLIGKSGSSGNSTGPHLHLTILKPGYTMNRSTRYSYMSRPSMVVWPLNNAWKGTSYSGGGRTRSSAHASGKQVVLRNLKYGTRNSNSVKLLKAAINKHYPEAKLNSTGNYGKTLDIWVRKCQKDHGFGPRPNRSDPVNKSNVGASQAAHLGLDVAE